MVKSFLLVGLGGSIGAMLRYLVATIWRTDNFPYNTLVINIVGSLLIGIVFALSEKTDLINDNMKLFLATGICGGFTTFSTFSAENFQLLKLLKHFIILPLKTQHNLIKIIQKNRIKALKIQRK